EDAVAADARREASRAEATNDHPQLERAEAAAKLDAVIHKVDYGLALRRDEVLMHQREGALEDLGLGREERRAVERREEPFVRVDNERVGVIDAGEHVTHLGAYGGH